MRISAKLPLLVAVVALLSGLTVAVSVVDDLYQRELYMALLPGGIVVLLTAVLGAVAAREIARPLSRLQRAMEQLRAGEKDVEIPHMERNDEVGRLARSFESAAEALLKFQEQLEWRVEARSKSLEAAHAMSIAMAHDVQEATKKGDRAEAAMRLQSAALDAAANGIVITDHKGVICWVNPAFASLTGYTAKEVVGRTPRVLKSAKQDAAFYTELWKTIVAGRVWRGELVNRRKDGSTYIEEQTITPVRDEHGEITHFISIKQDITDRKRAEEKRRALESQFQRAQKMEVVGRLARGVAHEFNNLLTVVIGEAEMALASFSREHPLRESLEEIHKAGGRAATLTRQLLAFSRLYPVEPSVFNLNEVLDRSEKLLLRLVEEDIELVIRKASDLWATEGDRRQVEQVLVNLVVNACDAMAHGGELVIETGNVTLGEEYARSHAEVAAGDYVMLVVRDTGTGMTEEVKARLFEPFFTTKGIPAATGLGLAASYGIVKQMGGHITVHSELEVGSTINVYLQRVRDPAAAKQPVKQARKDAAPARRRSETILLVEDEAQVRRVGARMLQGQGFTVVEAGNGEEALRLLEKHPGPVHLLLTDVVMPRMGGPELADRIQALRPETKVLFASGYTDDELLRRQLLHREVVLVSKPFSPQVLVRRVREVLDSDPSR